MKRQPISSIKQAALASLYEHLLTADANAYWFLLDDVRTLIDPHPSGALLHIALKALIDERLVEISFEDGETDLYTLTPKGIEEAEKIHQRFFPSDSDVLDVADQRQRIVDIRETLDQIEKELRENNEIASQLNDDQRELFAGEVAAAQTLVSRKKFRLSRVVALVVPLLRYLGDKFTGSAIGELAKQLIGLLLG